MTKQFRNIFLALIVIVNFSSCSFHYFYPLRVDVYGFDSSGQTKGVVEPYFNMLNLHLGIAHSFSDHIFTSVGVQGDCKPIDPFGENAFHRSRGVAANLNLGYYSHTNKGLGYEIVPGFSYERNIAVYTDYPFLGGGMTNQNWYYDSITRYSIPSLQGSVYRKGGNSNVYFALRLSYLFVDSTSRKVNGNYLEYYRTYYPSSFLIEPSIQFSFKKSRTLRYFISMHIGTSKTNYFSMIPPFQAGFKFLIE